MKLSKILSTSVAISALGFASVSSAVFIDATVGGTTITVVDEGAGDLSSGTAGLLNTAHVIGGWEVEAGLAITKPAITAPGDIMQLTTTGYDFFGGVDGDLVISATEYGFTDAGSLSAFNSMTTTSSVANGITAELFISAANDGSDWLALSTVVSSDASNHGDLYNLGSAAAPFGLMIVHTYKAIGAATYWDHDDNVSTPDVAKYDDGGVSGGSTTIAKIPEPSIIALMGLGLVGMGVATRRKQKAA